MNPPRSIYKTDYAPHSCLENSFSAIADQFCSSDNVDDCLRYLSRELCALGYPSIYSSSSCPFSVNCDIIKLLNVTFELLKNFEEHAETKEELVDRNQRLQSDLTATRNKNAQLKESLELSERKYKSALERERQLKNKHDNLTQLIKKEKDESKKLSSQIQQQKVTYQHEIRKYETRLNQMKSRLSQVLADKNPDKRIANITSSHLLPRNTNQRGKWKTGLSAKNSAEEIYNSVISNYESRFQAAMKEIDEYQHSLKNIELQILEIISLVEGDSYDEKKIHNLNADLNSSDRFGSLISKLKEFVANNIFNKSASVQVLSSKANLSEYSNIEKYEEQCQIGKNTDSNCADNINSSGKVSQTYKGQNDTDKENLEREILIKEKQALSATLLQIKEEKSKLEAEKLEVINVVIRQRASMHPQNSKSVPSFSVVTAKNSLTAIPAAHQLKKSLSSPDELVDSMSQLWKMNVLKTKENSASTSPITCNNNINLNPQNLLNDFVSDELPKWAHAAAATPLELDLSAEDTFLSQDTSDIQNVFHGEKESVSELQSEEENLAKLRAAFKDIESRRSNLSSN